LKLELDFSQARETAGFDYIGILARVTGQDPVKVDLTADGCSFGGGRDSDLTIRCENPEIDLEQAWNVIVLLTGHKDIKPVERGVWNENKTILTFTIFRRRPFIAG
jgi:hypothetical protein